MGENLPVEGLSAFLERRHKNLLRGFLELRRRTQTDVRKESFVVVDQEGRRCTWFCYPVESMNRTEGQKVFSLELRGEADRRKKVKLVWQYSWVLAGGAKEFR